jgi:hypothetical protein
MRTHSMSHIFVDSKRSSVHYFHARDRRKSMRENVVKLLMQSFKKAFPNYKKELKDGLARVFGGAIGLASFIGALLFIGWILESKEAKDIGLFLLLVAGNAIEAMPGWGWMGLFFAVIFLLTARRNRQQQEIIIAMLDDIQRKLE